jgi:hypothetical protein
MNSDLVELNIEMLFEYPDHDGGLQTIGTMKKKK